MNQSHTNAIPRLLLVEDDPVSAAFLRDAASAFPADVIHAGTIAEALETCAQQHFDLLLVDANLPDGRGEALLQRLQARPNTPLALAHTADTDPRNHAQLLAAGFQEVLPKPLPVAKLHAALRQHLPVLPIVAAPNASELELAPVWDDAGALAVLGGQHAHVAALRNLFLSDLPEQQRRIAAAVGRSDSAGIRAELHRLSASCGFVGAARMAQAVRALRATPLDHDALQAFNAEIDGVLKVAF